MLSGYICVRNAIKLDYPVSLAIESLIPVVDELVLCDSDSDDGTTDLLHDWARRDSRVRVVNRPWTNPVRDLHWWTAWLNWTREQLRGDMQITLDADEVLDPAGYDAVRQLAKDGQCAMFKRLNFWGDASHTAPHNRACGTMVARLGPRHLYMPSDEPHPAVHPNVRTSAKERPDIRIFHYGFIRRPEAFIAKSKTVQAAFFGTVDQRLLDMETKQQDWRGRDYFDGEPLEPFTGRHPEFCKSWLRERGYAV